MSPSKENIFNEIPVLRPVEFIAVRMVVMGGVNSHIWNTSNYA